MRERELLYTKVVATQWLSRWLRLERVENGTKAMRASCSRNVTRQMRATCENECSPDLSALMRSGLVVKTEIGESK